MEISQMKGSNRMQTLSEWAARNEGVFRHSLLVAMVVAVSVVFGVSMAANMSDPDIWWHLRTGQWVVEHGSVPFTDHYTQYGFAKHWVAYSWLYEVVIYGLHTHLGLSGIL
ncbi:MAG: hypothetical protein HN348_35795, partial [Proteobacteria bacterium]|nr:hypothetical protein [Pseudomonadota bacterium]